MPSAIALIPARSGSERVKDKNIRPLAGHPLLAYAIASARQAGLFDRVICSTDSGKIAEVAQRYGADIPFLRPPELATSTSPDIEWLTYTLEQLGEHYDLFAIVRATNPFRGPDVLQRGLQQLLATPEADSIRAVELVKQHPGKMWIVDGRVMRPLLEQSQLDVAWHAGQYQALPEVYVQNSALEIAWTRVVSQTGTREGRVRRPVLHERSRGLQRRRRGGLVARARARRFGSRLVARRRAAATSVFSRGMKVAHLETLYCDAGWRPWIFLKATTDDGAVGWAEITDSHGSPRGLGGIVEDLAPHVVGGDPRAVERIVWELFRATRQSPGSVIQKAIGGIENALLDLKGKALGVPVYELFGGPTRDDVDVYWSHCGTTRARAWQVTNTPKLAWYDDVTKLGAEVVARGFPAFKTNIVVPGDEPQVLMPGFHGGGLDRNPSPEIADALVQLLDAFAEGTEGKAEPIVDLNFNLDRGRRPARRPGARGPRPGLARGRPLRPGALAVVRGGSPMPICSGENLYASRGFRPFLEAGAMDVASVDVIWNGFHQAKKIADLAETFEVNCAPHNYYSHLATFISAQWCAAIPNARILEVDVDDVPWREELTTAVPEIRGGELTIPAGPAGAPTSTRTCSARIPGRPDAHPPRRSSTALGDDLAPASVTCAARTRSPR